MAYHKRMISAFILLAGCNSTAPVFTPTIVPSKWNVGCQPDQKDAFGKLFERAKCWAMLTDFKQSNLGLAHGVGIIFEINHSGAKLIMQPKFSADVCEHKTPTKKAVDGVRVDKLPMSQQILAVRKGRIYARETNRGFPYCNINTTVAHVNGANDAYLKMISKWKAKNF